MEQQTTFASFISKLFGLQLYDSYVKDRNGKAPSLSLIRILYSVLLFAGYLVSLTKALETIFPTDPIAAKGPSIFRFGMMTHVYSGVLGSIICALFLFRTERMRCVYQEAIRTNSAKVNDRYHQFRKMVVPSKQSWLVPASVVMLFAVSLSEGYAQHSTSNYFAFVALIYPLWLFHLTILQFTELVQSTRCILTKLNWMLDAFLESLQKQAAGGLQHANTEKDVLEHVTSAISQTAYISSHDLISGDRLTYMFIIHENVAKLAEYINAAHSLQVIAIVSVAFVNTLFAFFIETKLLFWNLHMYDLILQAARYAFEWIPGCLLIYYMLLVCASTHNELFKSATLLHKLLQYKSNFFIDDQALFERSKAIALQLLHRKRVSLFDGSGLFQLDFTFIFSIFSAATSYLIVLLQFDLSKDLQKATL
ncbi:gustatory and pheromone receptor 33a-like [Anopheles aquasalis]|uniref:gustatory and pheromone receptor 33a-like n=1 Tax=Anopheles aquasalis TaxID=42839 RepID=UPI00215A8CD6|nr:gustatory and pheromone receptor 33a-like [Anopheles aquasalis]